MLDEKDLQAIAQLINASEERTRKAIHEEINESEDRNRRYFNELIENVVRKDIGAVADGVETINDRLPNVDKIVDLQDRVSVLETSDEAQNKAIKELQKAQ